MKINFILLGTFLILYLVACTSAQEMKDEAEAEYTEEKTETLKEYKACVKESEGAEAKMAQCEALLKAVGAVEGGTVQSSAPAPATPAESTAPTENTEPVE